MPALRDRILALLRDEPGLTDREIANRLMSRGAPSSRSTKHVATSPPEGLSSGAGEPMDSRATTEIECQEATAVRFASDE